MFSLIAILAVVLTVATLPIFTARLVVKSNRDDLESERELLATAVRVEKYQNSWCARYRSSDWEISRRCDGDAT